MRMLSQAVRSLQGATVVIFGSTPVVQESRRSARIGTASPPARCCLCRAAPPLRWGSLRISVGKA